MIEIKLNNQVIEIGSINFIFTCIGLLNQIIKTITFIYFSLNLITKFPRFEILKDTIFN